MWQQEKPSLGDIKGAASRGRLAANYYGFTCDWCWRKGTGSEGGGWHDTKSAETHFFRSFSKNGVEIRLCLKCAKKLKKCRWFPCCSCSLKKN